MIVGPSHDLWYLSHALNIWRVCCTFSLLLSLLCTPDPSGTEHPLHGYMHALEEDFVCMRMDFSLTQTPAFLISSLSLYYLICRWTPEGNQSTSANHLSLTITTIATITRPFSSPEPSAGITYGVIK